MPNKHPLRAFRETHDPPLNQTEAAALVGVTQSMWSRLEAGLTFCRPSLAKRISEVTGVSMDLLLNFGEDESSLNILGVRRRMR